jgi:hypothetical protein
MGCSKPYLPQQGRRHSFRKGGKATTQPLPHFSIPSPFKLPL